MFGGSGKGVQLLTDWQIGDALLRIVSEARLRLVLVSPYNKHWGHLRREIAMAGERGVQVSMYYRADEANPLTDYGEGEGISGVAVRMLHAKIYANENAALVTTMNLLDSSAMYSREIGLLIREVKLRREVDRYIQALAGAEVVPGTGATEGNRSGGVRPAASAGTAPLAGTGAAPGTGAAGGSRNGGVRPGASGTSRTATAIAEYINASGFCIKCGEAKGFEPERPLCAPCYSRHGRVGVHQVCHRCGSAAATQVAQPFCEACHNARQAGG